jgi:hypothetical protein
MVRENVLLDLGFGVLGVYYLVRKNAEELVTVLVMMLPKQYLSLRVHWTRTHVILALPELLQAI